MQTYIFRAYIGVFYVGACLFSLGNVNASFMSYVKGKVGSKFRNGSQPTLSAKERVAIADSENLLFSSNRELLAHSDIELANDTDEVIEGGIMNYSLSSFHMGRDFSIREWREYMRMQEGNNDELANEITLDDRQVKNLRNEIGETRTSLLLTTEELDEARFDSHVYDNQNILSLRNFAYDLETQVAKAFESKAKDPNNSVYIVDNYKKFPGNFIEELNNRLCHHADDSNFKIYVLILPNIKLNEFTQLAVKSVHNSVFRETPAMLAIYDYNNPQNSTIELGAISNSLLDNNKIHKTTMKVLRETTLKGEPKAQFTRFIYELSFHAYWLEDEILKHRIGREIFAQTQSMSSQKRRARLNKNSTSISTKKYTSPLTTPKSTTANTNVASLAKHRIVSNNQGKIFLKLLTRVCIGIFLGLLSFLVLRKLFRNIIEKKTYRFPPQNYVTRLGAPYSGGHSAVFYYGKDKTWLKK